ncbi:PAS domain-containing protein [Hymenobacter latericus]|uniref:PAS domain-containing protein n=1 Tax=Hymenobacter sp. YIM 151858-1 TaxID=2987688 RepID=UPI002226FA81|nr:PAS domain-containing protein [Hymenobacter sp. YIM 151858-1]UYZ60626.1 PAS domain-containing protein [Hymenobacter sp. YIM 151858-1]
MRTEQPDPVAELSRLESVLEAAGVGIWQMELPSRELSWSARCKLLYGLPVDQPVTLPDLYNAIHPDDRAGVEQAIEAVLKPGSSGRYFKEYRVIWPDGAVRWIRSTGRTRRHPDTGLPVRFEGISRDVTEPQQEALQLQRQAQEYLFLAENVSEILWMARPDGGVTYFNQRWMAYTGQTLQQAQEWGWEPVIHPDDLPRCLERWTNSLRTQQLYEVEYRFRRHDGEYRWYLGRALPMCDANGNVLKWFGTCTDIHEQKQTEQLLRAREDELQRAYQDLESKVTFRNLELERLLREQANRIAALEAQLGAGSAAAVPSA